VNQLPYNSFNRYLRQRFGGTVWRVTLEAGFTCPNRDGLRGYGGCTFCTADGSSSRAQDPSHDISRQLAEGIDMQARRHGASMFMAYLQSFTNTYAPIDQLRRTYEAAIDHPQVVALAIGTRPDCLPQEVLELLAQYSQRLELWLDLGLESAHDHTLRRINRGHSYAEFLDAVYRLRQQVPEAKICAHMIAGLPGEDRDGLRLSLETGLTLARLPIHGIKIHNLCILRGTQLAYGDVRPVDREEYLEMVIQVLANLPREVTVQRLMGEPPSHEDLIAPAWASDKNGFLLELRERMHRRGLRQGCLEVAQLGSSVP
jgi:radical SAM protein (TIGR01212 family)